jgi:hypothetical protein
MADAYVIKLDPAPYEQYFVSQGLRGGDLAFLSGQDPITADGAIIRWRLRYSSRRNISKHAARPWSSWVIARQSHLGDHLSHRYKGRSQHDHDTAAKHGSARPTQPTPSSRCPRWVILRDVWKIDAIALVDGTVTR